MDYSELNLEINLDSLFYFLDNNGIYNTQITEKFINYIYE
jgi:hypothetical protein